MTTWTLTKSHCLRDGIRISDVLRDGIPALCDVDYFAARQYIYAHAADDDLYLEAENPRFQGETVSALKAQDADMQLYYGGAITYEEYERRHLPVILLALLLAATILLVAARAAQAGTLYLPATPAGGKAWLTPADLAQGLAGAGYDPAAVAQYTWCELHQTAQPPALLRYSACTLDLTPDDDTDAYGVVFWWDAGAQVVTWAVVAQ